MRRNKVTTNVNRQMQRWTPRVSEAVPQVAPTPFRFWQYPSGLSINARSLVAEVLDKEAA